MDICSIDNKIEMLLVHIDQYMDLIQWYPDKLKCQCRCQYESNRKLHSNSEIYLSECNFTNISHS